ncbi:MAG TPA: transglycosylase domain-containing protein, partial [Bacteroidales bacterium]|nr:transglycosylase domain-containing protein [Bacteroidales bacterium]
MASESNRKKLYLRIFWALVTIPVLVIVLVFVLISSGKFGDLPTFKKLENPENNLASEIYTEDNQLLGKYYIENRSFVDYADLSPDVVHALIATEDIRFERHSGIDVRGLFRVILKTILGGQNTGGGSTLTQQLAKNLFNTRNLEDHGKLRRTIDLVIVKFKEWNTAVRLERYYTKKEILVMYLNTVTFGHEAYGIKSASRMFFNTTPDSLTLQQSADLVGLLRAPTYYSPILNPERSIRRRNVVLSQMEKYGFINSEVSDSVMQLPLVTDYNVQSHITGLATHFRTFLRETLKAAKPERENYYSYELYRQDSARWVDEPLYGWANKNFKPDGTPYNIFTDGLKIYTTIDSRIQEYAEEAIAEHLGPLQDEFFREKKGVSYAPFSKDLSRKEINHIMMMALRRTDRYRRLRSADMPMDSILENFKTPREMRVFSWNGDIDTVMTPYDSIRYYKYFLRTGFMAMEPVSGHVKAYVGDHHIKYFKYDHVTQGKRQVGSTIKPFLYTLAMQEGYKPCDLVSNTPVTFMDHDSVWTPRNSGHYEMEGKMVTLEWGLAASSNYIAAWLVKQFNPQAVIDVIRKMGVTSDIAAVPSVIFGTSDISLKEMVGAFNTFSNKGVYIEPVYVTKITDRYGNVISSFQPKEQEAISDQTAYLMVKLLDNVVNRGTAYRLRWFYKFEAEMGGKTGTSQNQSDGW